MNWRIIGSVAAYHWFPDARAPSDIDLLTPAKITGNLSTTCVVDAQWHDAAQYMIDINKDPVFLDPDSLLTLKVSHAHWDVKWNKTMFDVQFFKMKGCQVNMELYHKLFKVWEVVHGKKRVNMSKSMDVFFNDAVTRKYDHEELHKLVAFYDAPMHEQLRPDHGTAWCDVKRFDALSQDDKARVALEEIMAVAIERFQLTAKSPNSVKRCAMSNAYKKLCTSMTTGWFARFLILNQRELLFTRRDEWIPILNSALRNLQ